MNRFILLIIILFFSNVAKSTAQDGSPDLSFGVNGLAITEYAENFPTLASFDKGSSGRIGISGVRETPEFLYGYINVYTQNGLLDNSFGNDGTINLENAEIENIKVISNDQIIYDLGVFSRNTITKLNINGSVDTQFAENGVLQTFGNNIIARPYQLDMDENIVAIGKNENGSENEFVIRRFLQNGERDNSFGDSGQVIFRSGLQLGTLVDNIHFFPNGDIIFHFGITTTDNETTIRTNKLVKLKNNGEYDSSYGIDGILSFIIEEDFPVKVDFFEDNSFLEYYAYYLNQETSLTRKIIRYNQDGTIDFTFGEDGEISGLTLCYIQNNGRFITDSAQFTDQGGIRPNLSRFYSDGNIDSSFNFTFNYTDLSSYNLLQTEQGEILFAGMDYSESDSGVYLILAQYRNSPLSVDEFENTNFKIYPNPSTGIFTLESNSISENTNYQITDLTGKIVQIGNIQLSQTHINLESAQDGIYFLKIDKKTFKLLKN